MGFQDVMLALFFPSESRYVMFCVVAVGSFHPSGSVGGFLSPPRLWHLQFVDLLRAGAPLTARYSGLRCGLHLYIMVCISLRMRRLGLFSGRVSVLSV